MKRLVSVTIGLAAVLLVAACLGPPGGTGGATDAGGEAQRVTGRATAGPICPVERNPPDPACAPRPVAGAVLVIQNGAGSEVARTTSDADGRFSLTLEPGSYRLVPQAAQGVMGGARPVDFQVVAGQQSKPLQVSYDTGIR